jgi:hypothetical protein
MATNTNSEENKTKPKIFYSNGAITSSTKQLPGMIKKDTINQYWYCTSYTTVDGDYLWDKIEFDESTSTPFPVLTGNYAIVAFVAANQVHSATRQEQLGGVTNTDVVFTTAKTNDSKKRYFHPVGNLPVSSSSAIIAVFIELYYYQVSQATRNNALHGKRALAWDYYERNGAANDIISIRAAIKNRGPAILAAQTNGTSSSTSTSSKQNPATSNANNPLLNTGLRNSVDNGKTTVAATVVTLPDLPGFPSGTPVGTHPYMEQRYFTTKVDAKDKDIIYSQPVTRRHIFDIVPNSFEFSQLSSTWNDTARGGNYPLVDWSNYNLMKVSFKFLVSAKRSDGVNNDGLQISIDEQIANIRSMGGAPYPIKLLNMNTLLSDSYRFPYLSKGKGIQFIIADMSVAATRLTQNGKNISAAEVSITLEEFPEIRRDVIALPPLRPTTIKPPKPGTEKGEELLVLTDKGTNADLNRDLYVFNPAQPN